MQSKWIKFLIQKININIYEKEIVDTENEQIVKIPKSDNTFNEFSFTYSLVIKSYQRFISSQDRDLCMFQPSCSVFSEQAVREYGLFKGILMTSDRLMRCNGVGSLYYEHTNPETNKIIDLIENYKWIIS